MWSLANEPQPEKDLVRNTASVEGDRDEPRGSFVRPEPTAGHNLLVVFSTSLPGIPGPSIRTQKVHESGPHSSLHSRPPSELLLFTL